MLNWIRQFVGRHFTWLSGTLLAGSIAIIVLLTVFFVPSNLISDLFQTTLKGVGVLLTALTLVGTILTIHDWWSKRKPKLSLSSANENGENSLSTPARGFVKTDEEKMREAMGELDGWFEIQEQGDIILRPVPDQYNIDRKAMLYVFAAKVAYDADERPTPKVSKQELMDEMGFSSAAAGVFISKMGDFIDRDFDPDDTETLVEMEEEDIIFETNPSEALNIAEYITEERTSPN